MISVTRLYNCRLTYQTSFHALPLKLWFLQQTTVGAGPPDPWCQQQPLCIQSIAPQDRSSEWRCGNRSYVQKLGKKTSQSLSTQRKSIRTLEPFAPDCYIDIIRQLLHYAPLLHPCNFHVPGRATGPSHHPSKAWDVSLRIWCTILHGTCWTKDFNKLLLSFIVQDKQPLQVMEWH